MICSENRVALCGHVRPAAQGPWCALRENSSRLGTQARTHQSVVAAIKHSSSIIEKLSQNLLAHCRGRSKCGVLRRRKIARNVQPAAHSTQQVSTNIITAARTLINDLTSLQRTA
jgi:hypothetical protein